MTPKQLRKLKDIENYYETLDLSKVKHRKNVKDELLYQLYYNAKEPKKGYPKYNNALKNDIHMADLLFLPNDNGFEYALVVVDVGSRLCDAEPIRNKKAITVLQAIKKIYKRGVLDYPLQIKVDDGSEFKGAFKTFFVNNGSKFFSAQPARHRQIALVEARNRQIGTYLFKRMTAQELKTGETSREWVKWLPKIVAILNKKMVRKPVINESDEFNVDYKTLLPVGTMVRYKLDRPIDVTTEKRLYGNFRSSDIKFSLQPTEIKQIALSPDNPPLYALEGKKAFYTRQQLLPVEESRLPPDSLQERFILEEILGKQQMNRKQYYLVKFKGEAEPILTLASHLKQDVPEIVKEYEKQHRLKKKEQPPKPKPQPKPKINKPKRIIKPKEMKAERPTRVQPSRKAKQ